VTPTACVCCSRVSLNVFLYQVLGVHVPLQFSVYVFCTSCLMSVTACLCLVDLRLCLYLAFLSVCVVSLSLCVYISVSCSVRI
jgi:hypothetical protein